MDYGRGSIYQRTSDGRWCATIQLPEARGGGKRRHRKTLTALTRQGVEERLDAYRAANPALGQSRDSQGSRRANLDRGRKVGRHTEREWRDLVAAVGGRCEYCGIQTDTMFRGPDGKPTTKSPKKRVKDHRTPLAAGGSDAIENVACVCQRCNGLKGVMDEPTFRAWLAAQ